jgi:hypothetical protein
MTKTFRDEVIESLSKAIYETEFKDLCVSSQNDVKENADKIISLAVKRVEGMKKCSPTKLDINSNGYDEIIQELRREK